MQKKKNVNSVIKKQNFIKKPNEEIPNASKYSNKNKALEKNNTQPLSLAFDINDISNPGNNKLSKSSRSLNQKSVLTEKLNKLKNEFEAALQTKKKLEAEVYSARIRANKSFSQTTDSAELNTNLQILRQKLNKTQTKYKSNLKLIEQMKTQLDEYRISKIYPQSGNKSINQETQKENEFLKRSQNPIINELNQKSNELFQKTDEFQSILGKVLDFTGMKNINEVFYEAERLERENKNIDQYLSINEPILPKLIEKRDELKKNCDELLTQRQKETEAQNEMLHDMSIDFSNIQIHLSEIETQKKKDENSFSDVFFEIEQIYDILGCDFDDISNSRESGIEMLSENEEEDEKINSENESNEQIEGFVNENNEQIENYETKNKEQNENFETESTEQTDNYETESTEQTDNYETESNEETDNYDAESYEQTKNDEQTEDDNTENNQQDINDEIKSNEQTKNKNTENEEETNNYENNEQTEDDSTENEEETNNYENENIEKAEVDSTESKQKTQNDEIKSNDQTSKDDNANNNKETENNEAKNTEQIENAEYEIENKENNNQIENEETNSFINDQNETENITSNYNNNNLNIIKSSKYTTHAATPTLNKTRLFNENNNDGPQSVRNNRLRVEVVTPVKRRNGGFFAATPHFKSQPEFEEIHRKYEENEEEEEESNEYVSKINSKNVLRALSIIESAVRKLVEKNEKQIALSEENDDDLSSQRLDSSGSITQLIQNSEK